MIRNDKILFDSDVFRHFQVGKQLSKLNLIYPKRICLVDIVINELKRSPALILPVEDFISQYKIPIITFPSTGDILKEYAYLTSKRFKGEGESACLAMARFQDYCLASSNIKDIQNYCAINSLRYVTTMDILIAANKAQILSVDECNQFIKDVRNAGSRLPVNSIQEYVGGGYSIRSI